MEAYSYSVTSSSSSSSPSSLHNHQQEPNKPNNDPPTIFNSSLHSIRKPLAKPWKKPIAPLPPTPPKIYKVDSANFKEVVQRLTGAPPKTDQSRGLNNIAPSPIKISTPSSPVTFGEMMAAKTEDMKKSKIW